jgi:hypothetical protein
VTIAPLKRAAAALGLACCLPAPANAAAYVLGDSLGVGVAQVAHLKGLARISVHIRGSKAVEQIASIPAGSTAYLVLGTNDANGSIARLDKSIDNIIRAAQKQSIALVWVGPPCVRHAWDARARELDAILRAKLAATPVRYVSMRDDQMCSGALHEPDDVHLKKKGYLHMWQKAQIATGIEVASADPTQAVTATLAPRAAAKKTEPIPLPLPRRPFPAAAR